MKLCKIYGLADRLDDEPLWHELLDAMTPEWRTLPALHRKYWEWGLGLYGLHKLGCIRPGAVGLGVGAGVEWPLYYLANHVRRVEAIDLYSRESAFMNLDPTFPENARRLAPFPYREEALVFSRMDALDLKFPDETFDFVFSFSSIEHFGGHPGAVLAMQEIARVLKPNGIAAIATEVVLNGQWHSEFFQPEELEPTFVGGSGMQLVEPLDLSVDEEMLTNPVLFDVPPGFTGDTGPHTSVKAGNFIFTSIELFLRKPENWKPMSKRAMAAVRKDREAWYGRQPRPVPLPQFVKRPLKKVLQLFGWRR